MALLFLLLTNNNTQESRNPEFTDFWCQVIAKHVDGNLKKKKLIIIT